MPELPEVETTRAGLAPALVGRTLVRVDVRNPRLRWPIPDDLSAQLAGRTLAGLTRRGKYLLFDFSGDASGAATDSARRVGGGDLSRAAPATTQLVHLGMSGSLRLVAPAEPPAVHDHVDWRFDGGVTLRLRDPRRFGAVLLAADPATHPLLAHLGPEPLTDAFDAATLHAQTRARAAAIKQVIMDGHVVVGVGNIYASESLFHAGIRPGTAARRLTRPQCERLVAAIKKVLAAAIAAGGSSLRDYVATDGELGYFQLQTRVYDREGQPCKVCATPIKRSVMGQRATFHCPQCQR